MTETTSNGLTCEVIKDRSEIDAVKEQWLEWSQHPNVDPDFCVEIVFPDEHVIAPYIFAFRDDKQRLRGLAVCRLEAATLDLRIGYASLARPSVRQLTSMYRGLLGEDTALTRGPFLEALSAVLRRGEADVACLEYLPVLDPLYQPAIKLPGPFFRDWVPAKRGHWRMLLPETPIELDRKLKGDSRFQYRRLQRYARTFEEAFRGSTHLRTYTQLHEMDTLCKHAEEVAKDTYQRGLGAGFFDNATGRKRLELAARKGWLRGYVLYANDIPTAFWIGSLFKNNFYLAYTAYKEQFKRFDVGMVCFDRMLQDLCGHGPIEVDFGFGDAFYKQRFGDRRVEEASVYLFSRSLRSMLLNGVRTSTELGREVLQRCAGRMGVVGKIKKLWRRSMAGKSGQNSTR